MAHYVLLEFLDDESAKAFVQETLEIKNTSETLSGIPVEALPTVAGVYRKPMQYCECTAGWSVRERNGGTVRGTKFGWYVHRRCGKIQKGFVTRPGEVIFGTLGTNLIPRELSGIYAPPRGWNSPLEWRFLIPKVSLEKS